MGLTPRPGTRAAPRPCARCAPISERSGAPGAVAPVADRTGWSRTASSTPEPSAAWGSRDPRRTRCREPVGGSIAVVLRASWPVVDHPPLPVGRRGHACLDCGVGVVEDGQAAPLLLAVVHALAPDATAPPATWCARTWTPRVGRWCVRGCTPPRSATALRPPSDATTSPEGGAFVARTRRRIGSAPPSSHSCGAHRDQRWVVTGVRRLQCELYVMERLPLAPDG